MGDPYHGSRRLRRVTKTGTWLTVQPSTVNGTELGAQEWRGSLFLRYGLDPPYLHHYCDGCNTTFSIYHALDCKQGGLVTASHKEIRDRVADLAGKYFTPSHVRDDSLIFAGCAVKIPMENPARSKATAVTAVTPPLESTEKKGDLFICYLWKNSTDIVHKMRVVKTDAKYHLAKTPGKCLQEAERVKKKMYLEARLQQLRNFSHFVASVDGMLGVEATATLKRIARSLATKWRQPYSRTCGYVKSRVVITLLQATYR